MGSARFSRWTGRWPAERQSGSLQAWVPNGLSGSCKQPLGHNTHWPENNFLTGWGIWRVPTGQPWYMVARMKKPAYGLNDAPRRWLNIVDKELRSCECVPTRGDRWTYVFYFKQQKLATSKSSKNITFDSGTFDSAALDQLLDPYTGNNSKGYKPCGVISLHVDR